MACRPRVSGPYGRFRASSPSGSGLVRRSCRWRVWAWARQSQDKKASSASRQIAPPMMNGVGGRCLRRRQAPAAVAGHAAGVVGVVGRSEVEGVAVGESGHGRDRSQNAKASSASRRRPTPCLLTPTSPSRPEPPRDLPATESPTATDPDPMEPWEGCTRAGDGVGIGEVWDGHPYPAHSRTF